MSLTATIGALTEPAAHEHPAPPRHTVVLLAAGVLAGPLFLATTLLQFAVKADIDPRVHPLSMLSLGPAGWIQITNFIVTGLLVLASAAGLRRVLQRSPAGTGLTIVGIVTPDYRVMLAGGALSWLWVSAMTGYVLAGRPAVPR